MRDLIVFGVVFVLASFVTPRRLVVFKRAVEHPVLMVRARLLLRRLMGSR